MPKFRCEHCRQKIAAPDTHIGKRVRCPRCKQAVIVIEPVERASEVLAAPSPPGPHLSTQMPKPEPASVLTGKSPEDISSVFGQWVTTYGEHPEAQENVTQEHETERTWQHLPPIDERRSDPATAFRSDLPFGSPPPREVIVPAAEVFDRPVRRRSAPGLNSAAEVADLLRTLGPSSSEPAPDEGPRRRVAKTRRSVNEPRPAKLERPKTPPMVGLFGWISLAFGVSALGISVIGPASRFAVPLGSVGAIAAALAIVMATQLGASRTSASAGGMSASGAAVTLALLGANGIIPLAAHMSATTIMPGSSAPVRVAVAPSDGAYVPVTSPVIVGNIEARVTSVQLVQPIVYDGDWRTAHPMLDRQLQITLELKNVGPEVVNYQTWRRAETENDDLMLSDANGEGHRAVSLATFIPVGGVNSSVALKPGSRVSDVLVFDPPSDPHLDLKLDLPGANLNLPGATLRLSIPAGMIRVQAQ
jgi:phage FluMu protein Com